MTENRPDGWQEWSKYVLKELERLNTVYCALDKKVDKITIDIVKLKVKSGIWGAFGGAIPVLIALGYWILKGK